VTPTKRPDPEMDQVTPELDTLLAQFTDEEIETGVIAHSAVATSTEHHTTETLQRHLNAALFERSLAQLLRSARAAAGLSLADVAQRLGVTRSRVHQLEHEGANLELHTIQRYASTLGYDVRIVLVPRDGGTQALCALTHQPASLTNATEALDGD